MVPGRLPYPAKVSAPMDVTMIARLTPGAAVRVKLDPQDQNSIWIDPVTPA